MKNLICFFLIVLNGPSAMTQIMNSVYPEIPYSDLQLIAVEGNNIFTYGDCDASMFSTDGGVSWQIMEIAESIDAIRILPGTNGTKALYMTDDNIYELDILSQSMEKISNASLTLSAGKFYSIEAKGDQVYLVAAASIHKATIGTYDWTKVTDLIFNSSDDRAKESDITENILHVATFDGLYQRVDLTNATASVAYDFANRIYNMDMVNDDLGYMTVQGQPSIVKTTDGGAIFSSVPGIAENINVRAFDENLVMSVNTNRLYVSTDGGQTSTYVQIPQDGYSDLVYDACFTSDGTFYLAGKSSMILRSDDFGQSFENLNRYKRSSFNSIYINANGVGYAVGGAGSIAKTLNQGEDWEEVDAGINPEIYLNSVVVEASGRVLIGHDDGLYILENDVIVSEIDRPTIQMLYLPGAILATQRVNGGTVIAKSTDGGDTWVNKANITTSYSPIDQATTGKIYIPSGTDQVYTSSDLGETWDIETFSFMDIRRVSFFDNDRGVFVSDGKLYLTNDSGVNALQIANAYAIENIHFLTENYIVFTTAQNGQTTLRESTNGGNTFSTAASFCSSTEGSFYDAKGTVWLGQKGGHINKFEVDTTVDTEESEITEVSVYPNPISVGEMITIETENNESGTATIYDINGRIVMQSFLKPSENQFTISDADAGYYFLELKTATTRSIGKLVVID